MYLGIVKLLNVVLIFIAFESDKTRASPGEMDYRDYPLKVLRKVERTNKEITSMRRDIFEVTNNLHSLKKTVHEKLKVIAEQLGVYFTTIESDDKEDKRATTFEKYIGDRISAQPGLSNIISNHGDNVGVSKRKFKRDVKSHPAKSLLELVMSNSENINKLVANYEACKKMDGIETILETWKESTDSFFVATFFLLTDIAFSTSVRFLKHEDDMKDLIDYFESAIMSKNNSQFFLEKAETLQDWYTNNVTSVRETFSSCKDVFHRGFTESGIYNITIDMKPGVMEVSCDQETDGGGWLVIQRRQDGTVDFYRNWTEYKAGFGSPVGEFWIGNDMLNYLTTLKPQELRVDLIDFDGAEAFAKYSSFIVANESDNYRLTVNGYSGTAGDSLNYHSGSTFSTMDKDNDGSNCPISRQGAWWYDSCDESNLNGPYLKSKEIKRASINWYHWKSADESLKKTQMKIRPNN